MYGLLSAKAQLIPLDSKDSTAETFTKIYKYVNQTLEIAEDDHSGKSYEVYSDLTERDGNTDNLPKLFWVNWFRKGDDGSFLWPGFGENSRVLKWVVERIDGQAAAVETPIGHVPTVDSLDLDGLDVTREEIAAALEVKPEEWREEIPQITEWFDKFGDKLPTVLWTELDGLKSRLG